MDRRLSKILLGSLCFSLWCYFDVTIPKPMPQLQSIDYQLQFMMPIIKIIHEIDFFSRIRNAENE